MAGLFGRKSFTLDFKHRALHSLKANHGNISKTARELNISRQNLQQWHNDASTINKAVKRNDIKSRTTRRVRKRMGQYPLLDAELLKYVIEKNQKILRVTYRSLQKQALCVFAELYPLIKDKFRSSNG